MDKGHRGRKSPGGHESRLYDNAAEITADTIAQRLNALLDERGWSIYRLHQESGLSQRHLGQLAAGQVKKPRMATILRLSEALGVPPAALDPEAPAGREFSVALTADEEDVVYAVSAARRMPIGAVVRDAVQESLVRWGDNPDIRIVLRAIQSRRTGRK